MVRSSDVSPPISRPEIAAAAAALARGEAVVMPTETVYGLAADARSDAAVGHVFELKGRPSDHPLIVHIARLEELEEWAADVPEAARALARAFWPGPLTMVLQRAPGVSDRITGGQDTVAIRMPAHPVARALLLRFGRAVVAPSANPFGRLSPTSAEHVRSLFGARTPLLLDAGPCQVGIESTIIQVRAEGWRLLRPGVIDRDRITALIGPERDDGPAVRVSGALASHYAPRTPLLQVDDRERLRAMMVAGGGRVGAVLLHPLEDATGPARVLGDVPAPYAQAIYAALHSLDALGLDTILVEAPPDDAAWEGVRDRLRRAAHGSAG